jgi:hypothetical protein
MAHSLPEFPAKGAWMTTKLVVLRPFAGFKRGDTIMDAAAIAKIMSSEQAYSVVRVNVSEG